MSASRELDQSIARLRRRYPARSRSGQMWRAVWPLLPVVAALLLGQAMPARPPGVCCVSAECLYLAVLLAAGLGGAGAAAFAATGAAGAIGGAYLSQVPAAGDASGLIWLAAHLGCLAAVILFYAIRWRYIRLTTW